MSFMTMDDRAYIVALSGIYEMNNVSLLREVYIDAYLASAQNYETLRIEVDAPEKAAAAYRDFVKEAVRSSVLDLKAFDPNAVMSMAEAKNIPEQTVK